MFRSLGQALKIINGFSLLAVFFVPTVAFSQAGFADLVERELELTEQIETESAVSGPRSVSLIDLLVDLSLVYEEMGNYELASTVTDRLLEVIRANYGLHSLEQVPGIRSLMSRQEERGDAVGLWEIEQDLLDLANRNPDDPRSISILSDAAARRLEILRRYEAGEFPEEIVLGCYYAGSFYNPDARLRGSRPMSSTTVDPIRRSCTAGSSSRVKQSLLDEALSMYSSAANVALRAEAFDDAEFRALLANIIRISHRRGNLSMGRRAYNILRDYEADTGGTVLARAEALVNLGDWEMFNARDLGTILGEAALSYYEEAYELLRQHDVPQESIDALVTPAVPVVLPSFLRNPLVSSESGAGYIDVSFTITADGKSDDIEVVDTSANVERADERDLVQLIKRNRFRPRFANGELLDPAPVSLRYYLSQ